MVLQLTAVTFQVILVALLFAGALIKLADLRGSTQPGKKFVGLLALSLSSFALGQTLSFPVITKALDAVTTAGTGKLVYNLFVVAGLCALQSFFAGVGQSPRLSRRSLLQIWSLGTIVIVALALLISSTPAEYRGHSLTSPYLDYPTVFSFYAVGGVFFIYVFTLCVMHIRRNSIKAHGATAVALKILALGLAVLVVASLVRLVRVIAVTLTKDPLLTLNSATFWLNNLGYIIVTIGLSIAGIAQLVAAWRWRHHRRDQYQALAPLWSALTDAFPGITLPENSPQPRRLQSSSLFRHRFQRRVIEIQDGLLRLNHRSPHLLGLDIQDTDPDVIAEQIHRALAQPDVPNNPPPSTTADNKEQRPTSPEETIEALADISRAFTRVTQ